VSDPNDSFWFHQVPVFAVLFEAHLLGLAVRVEAQHGCGHTGPTGSMYRISRGTTWATRKSMSAGEYTARPFADGICRASFVGAGAETVGGFDLDAEKAVAVVENEVVALGVSPGLGHAEAELGGFVEEGGFGALSGTLGVAEPLGTTAFSLHFGAHKREKARL
jgi:hypothetical protein